MTDDQLLALLNQAAAALDEEAAWLVDIDIDDRGRQRPDVPAADRPYYDALNGQAQALRGLVGMVRQRQAG